MGGKSGGGYRAPVEAPNSLQSMQEVTIVEAVSEGPIVGLATGDARSIAFNETPLMTEGGAYTYQNVSWAVRPGTADQDAFADVSGVETEVTVGVEVTKNFPRASGSGSGAITRQITNPYCTAVRVTMSVGALYEQLVDQDRAGDTVAMTISYNVLIKDKDENIVANDNVERTDKTTSGAQWAKKYALTGSAPWTVTVTKTYEDNTSGYKHNDIYWAAYTEIIGYKMIYPHTACMMVRGNAETFGSSVPNRAYKIKGLIVEVPSNYDPATRQYSGIWDGTFKNAWTDNPAWVLRDIIESGRYGLKKFFPPAKQGNALCDKWTLYEIAKYCDEYVSDGSGGVEPRYTFNGQIMGSGSAREVLQSIASNFHGMMYWSSGMVIASSDVPKDPVKSLTQANIIDGNLSYSTGSAQERHSVALVTWYDPDNYCNARIEPVYDWDAYQRYGYRPINVTAYGCTSRAQAHRQGLWTLLTEDEQWQASCEVGLDGYDLMPGDFVRIADPKWMGTRFSGRIESIDGTSVTLDGEVGFASGESYVLYVVMPDGTEEHRNITTGAGTHTTITIASAFDKTPVDHAVWTISGTDVAPRLFAVRSIEETQNGRLRLSLREVISAKYTRLEQSIEFTTTPGRRPTVGVLDAPTGLTVVPANYISGGQVYQRLTFSWVGSGDSAVSEYEFGYRSPAGDWNSFTPKKTYSMDIAAAASGTYIFRVRALSLDGRQSSWAEKSYTLEGVTTKPKKPTELKAEGGYRSIKVSWQMPSDALVGYFEILMADSDNVEDAELVGKIYGSSFDVMGLGVMETRWFWVRSVSYAADAVKSEAIGPVSATTKAIETDDIPDGTIQESHLAPSLAASIDRIPEIEEGAQERLESAKEFLSGEIKSLREYADEQLSSAAEAAIGALDMVKDVGDKLSDAGVYVDPDSGQVKIYGLEVLREETDVRLSNAEIRLDAQAAQISSKVTLAQVDERIAEAVFGDIGELVVSGINARIDEVEETLDAQAVAISEKASSTQVADHELRLTTAESDILGLDAAIALKASQLEVNALTQRVNSAELKIDAQNGVISQFVGQSEEDMEALSDASIQNAINGFENQKRNKESLAYAKQELKATIAEVDGKVEAEAAARLELGVQVEENSAALLEEQQVRATRDEAYGSLTTALVAQLDNDAGEAAVENAIQGYENSKALSKQSAAYFKELNTRIVAGQRSEAESREVLEASLGNALAQIEQVSKVTAGKPDVYNQPSAPSGSLKLGDLWIDNNSLIHRWTGSEWEECRDKELVELMELASAQTWLKAQVSAGGRKVLAGIGLLADTTTGSEITMLANRFYLVSSIDGELIQPFAVDANDPSNPKVVINGNLFVNALKDGGYTDGTGWIVGGNIAALNRIQIGDGGTLIMGDGSIFQMGSGAISIDSETGVLQIRDPNNLTTGNYIRVETGDITTYQYINGAYRPMRSLRVLETGEATNGERKYLTSLFPSAPQITVSIRDMVVFDPQYVGNKQRIRCLAQDIQYNAATGQASFMPSCILSLIGVVSNIVPPNNEPEAGVSIGDLGRGYITHPVDETYMLYPHTEFELLPGVEEVKINANIYAQIQTGREGSDWHPAYKMYYELYLYLVIGENEYLLGSTTYNCTLQKLDEYLSSHGATFESSSQTATGKITNITGTVDVPSTASLSTAGLKVRIYCPQRSHENNSLNRNDTGSHVWIRILEFTQTTGTDEIAVDGTVTYTAIAE